MTLAVGTRLGPYEVVELLGAGGMGEVYRARDPRLGRDVAVKVLPEEVAGDAQRLAFFEREARAVAALNHPNILTVHDVGTHAGAPYVVTELLEGENLRDLVSRRSPTVNQILSYALQAARGLEAAHAKDIVHRDLKPENLFLTTDGRVKILDFGLAKLVQREEVHTDAPTPSRSTAAGHVVGTVAYMSPEQARGHPVDARSDVFSFGVVLYELLASRHPFKRDTAAATLTAIVDETPAELERLSRGIPPAVGGIARRCLEKAREERYGSGHDVAVALEAVLAAPTGSAALAEVQERSPYPGLSSFTEKDAGVFFGREREVDELWGRIRNRRLLAVIGPSGVGKTSFVRAGVVASRPEGWAAIVCTPGTQPMVGLGRVLAPELAGDREALQELPRFDDPAVALDLISRWRKGHSEALLVVDQFEELYTLNSPEVQGRFAGLLDRLAREADVHVVLSLRDDFLIRCHEQPALAPVFEHLTPLLGLTAEGLNRALTEPAKKQGYHFEDAALVDEMVQAVEGARAALPLLAFAVSRLWEKRDRERKVLTRAAYEEIGGVAGALAQHAEATMDRIGSERQSLVREIFRNLVTAQGTRAVIDREELLSAFPERKTAEEVLGQLIDARLLTSYEVEEKEGEPSHHRIEVVHESLLKAWPRLVRWQTQDEDGAQLRDQLKQAAHLWEEKGRTPDLLWSGTALREYELWRERYPGKLTALEEDFSGSMVERARRRKRLRRAAVAAAFLVLAGVGAAIAVSRQQAVDSAQRAEASKLVGLAQLRLEDDPTEALAFATASLEVADTREARVSAVRALWQAPPALELADRESNPASLAFSPDGQWLAASGYAEHVGVWAETGERIALLGGHRVSPRGSNSAKWASHGLLVTGLCCGNADRVHAWSFPSGKRTRTIDFGGPSFWGVQRERLVAETPEDPTARMRTTYRLRSWRLPDGEAQELGQVDFEALGTSSSWFEPNGTGWLYTKGRTIYFRPLPVDGRGDQVVSRHDSPVRLLLTRPDRVVFVEESGRLHVCCSLSNGRPVLTESLPRPETASEVVDPDGSNRWLVGNTVDESMARIWSRATWPSARPLELRRSASWYGAGTDFHPTGDWLVVSTGSLSNLTFWPLRRAHPTVVDGYSALFRMLVFSPDSRLLVTGWSGLDDRLRLWPVGEKIREGPGVVELPERQVWTDARFDPSGRYLFVVGNSDRAYVVPLDGAPARRLEGFSDDSLLYSAAVSPSGRRVAAAFGYGDGEETLRVWDLDKGELRLFDLPKSVGAPTPGGEPASGQTGFEQGVSNLAFADESTLLSAGDGGIRRWDLDDGTHELLFAATPGYYPWMRLAATAQRAVVRQVRPTDLGECRPIEFVDLREGTSRALPAFGQCFGDMEGMALDLSGTVIATGDRDGVVRVGRLSGGEPHLLFGHEAVVQYVAISPDLRWVASSGEDNTLRLWPMPDLDEPPLHTLPHDALLAKLRSLTNIRAVRDPEAPNGWAIELDPFPGWKDVPTW